MLEDVNSKTSDQDNPYQRWFELSPTVEYAISQFRSLGPASAASLARAIFKGHSDYVKELHFALPSRKLFVESFNLIFPDPSEASFNPILS